MVALSTWIKQIILVVLFATFLELLIPSNSYKKFVKVIMGLLILLTVLQPVLELIHGQGDEQNATEVTARNIADNQTAMLNRPQDLQSERDKIALAQYRKELIKQIKVLAGTVEGIADTKAEVVLNEEKGDKNYAMIKNVTIYAKAGNADQDGARVKTIQQVEIGSVMRGSQEQAPLNEQSQQQIKGVVAEFYHLKPEQVLVKAWTGK